MKIWYNYYYTVCVGFIVYFALHLYLFIFMKYELLFNIHPKIDQNYDFIIVGGGSGGSVVAARLSENKNYKVLLIEAGTPLLPWMSDMPPMALSFQQSAFDWKFVTEPQNNACLAFRNKKSLWPRGKILGGSSFINYMVYLRGNKNDFNSWKNEESSEWSYDDVLYFFKQSENQIGRYRNSGFHGKGGLYDVDDLRYKSDFTDVFLDAVAEFNYTIGDLNGDLCTGFMETQITTSNGHRWSGAQIVQQIKNRTNLHILGNTMVEKVLIRDGVEAYGIVYKSHGDVKREVYSTKSVVLSAGTINTPKILMLSGIGPKQELDKFKIPVINDLPVGRNLQDHISTGLDLIILSEHKRFSFGQLFSPYNYYQYVKYKHGPLTYTPCEVVGLLKLNSSQTCDTSVPDIQLMVIDMPSTLDGGFNLWNALGISTKVWSKYFKLLMGETTATVMPVLLHPKSVGYVTIQSANPDESPLIQPNYLSHPDDKKILVKGIEFVKSFLNAKSMKKLNARLNTVLFPGCEDFVFDTYQYWECYVTHLTFTVYHPVGTCRMGYRTDNTSVVDHNLKVHGINNLYVMDASIMPSLSSANINSVVAMIAEKGAAILKQYWGNHFRKCKRIDLFIGVPKFTPAF